MKRKQSLGFEIAAWFYFCFARRSSPQWQNAVQLRTVATALGQGKESSTGVLQNPALLSEVMVLLVLGAFRA